MHHLHNYCLIFDTGWKGVDDQLIFVLIQVSLYGGQETNSWYYNLSMEHVSISWLSGFLCYFFIASINKVTKSNSGREMFISPYRLKSITEGN